MTRFHSNVQDLGPGDEIILAPNTALTLLEIYEEDRRCLVEFDYHGHRCQCLIPLDDLAEAKE